MRIFLAFIALWASLAVQADAAEPDLDAFVASELNASGLPGVSYAVVDGGKLSSGAKGSADLKTGKAVTPETPFQLASISKSFTAVAILQLVEAGEVELDGQVSRYLVVFRDRPGADITIRQLLAHTSGYSTLQGNSTHIDGPESEDALSRQIDRIAPWAPAHAPGSLWDYSNANYVILGGVIEAVSGLKYDQYVETRILQPIGMRNSLVGDGGVYEDIAVGHKPWFGRKRPVQDVKTTTSRMSAPAGGVVASAEDLALYLQMLLNGKDDIISAENKALMMQPASDQVPYYGLGWMLNPQDGAVYHTGTNPGVETIAILRPAEGKAVVVLVNAGSGMGFGETRNLIGGIIAHALGEDFVRDQSSWGRKSLFLTFVLLPLLFCAGTLQVWLRRPGLRAKSGLSGMFSLWFPLLTTLILAWVSAFLIPNLFGVSLGTLGIYSPDLSIALGATALTGLIWSVFRLGVYYSARLSV